MKVHGIRDFFSFFAYIKLYYQQNSVSTVIVNLGNFARLALIANENENKFFSVTCKTLIFSIFEKIFLIRVTNKSVVRYRFKSKLQSSNCMFVKCNRKLLFLQVRKALFVRTKEMYTKVGTLM